MNSGRNLAVLQKQASAPGMFNLSMTCCVVLLARQWLYCIHETKRYHLSCCCTFALQLRSARDALDNQLLLSQAEARSLARQLRETSQQLSLLKEDHAATEAVLARLKDERQQLLAVSFAEQSKAGCVRRH
jgi:hypothetical protein